MIGYDCFALNYFETAAKDRSRKVDRMQMAKNHICCYIPDLLLPRSGWFSIGERLPL